jgi:MYXO-CTERM domain-containing protein
VKCAVHPDRLALGYCSTCGKPLCKECLVRLSTGNFCDACANAPAGPPARVRRGMPWWAIGLIVLAALIVIRMVFR